MGARQDRRGHQRPLSRRHFAMQIDSNLCERPTISRSRTGTGPGRESGWGCVRARAGLLMRCLWHPSKHGRRYISSRKSGCNYEMNILASFATVVVGIRSAKSLVGAGGRRYRKSIGLTLPSD